jgi:hypothetical protein
MADTAGPAKHSSPVKPSQDGSGPKGLALAQEKPPASRKTLACRYLQRALAAKGKVLAEGHQG